jgi:hypothetical protein
MALSVQPRAAQKCWHLRKRSAKSTRHKCEQSTTALALGPLADLRQPRCLHDGVARTPPHLQHIPGPALVSAWGNPLAARQAVCRHDRGRPVLDRLRRGQQSVLPGQRRPLRPRAGALLHGPHRLRRQRPASGQAARCAAAAQPRPGPLSQPPPAPARHRDARRGSPARAAGRTVPAVEQRGRLRTRIRPAIAAIEQGRALAARMAAAARAAPAEPASPRGRAATSRSKVWR